MYEIMLVVTILAAGAIQQSDPEKMNDLDACITKGRQAIAVNQLDERDPDAIRSIAFTCARRPVRGVDG